ncbi:NAD-dependent DNA ligase LigA [Lachnospiraceae bacterium]|nr:NAD-dependent DNA ligase LigA [Lachnospiraceae bacterium]
MQKVHRKQKDEDVKKVAELVAKLNQYRHEYYNKAKPSVPDALYDHLFDELQKLEKKTGIILSNSPTQTVGFIPVSKLEKVRHPLPLLSLDKTKQTEELLQMAGKAPALLMLKLDGLTIKLVYENGHLVEASTRGDGDIGEVITHNIPAFYNVPTRIPRKGRLVITGEGLIHKDDFEEMKSRILGKADKEVCNARNLASGSIRLLNPADCKERHVYFYAFNILEGMEDFGKIADSRGRLLEAAGELGFAICPFTFLPEHVTLREIEDRIGCLKVLAEDGQIPIDGMVFRYDSLSYSKRCGRTGHHYKDGIAFKFEDDTFETVFRSIEWEPGRSGEIAPVAVFDTVEIDGCFVSRASLHNLSFIRDLELFPGCRVLVSKRNMIIPHIEENLDRGHYKKNMIPEACPCCGKPTRIFSRAGDKGKLVETLHCDNPDCSSQILHKFIHFAEKKAMDISGISEATIEKFMEMGFLKTFRDFYHLDRYKDEIVQMEGFGEKSYQKIIGSVEKSRNTTFTRYVVAMDIPMIGRTAGRILERHFQGDLQEFTKAAVNRFDFTSLPGVGETMCRNIWEWFHDGRNLKLWKTLQEEVHFKKMEDITMAKKNNSAKDSPFAGCTIVVTGKLENFTRNTIHEKLKSIGATAGSSVTKKTDYLICGEKPGSKLAKAKELGVPVLTEQEFLDRIPA